MAEESAAVSAPPEVNVSALAAASSGPEPAGANFSESFAELEKAMGTETPIAKEKEAAKPTPKAASGAGKKSDSSSEKGKSIGESSAKDATQNAKEESENASQENGKPLPAPELRKAYQDLKAKHAQLQKEYETFKAAPREDPEKKTLAEKLAAAEKHRQQLDQELRHTAYERSAEFKERYHAPFVSAYELGRETASQFKVTDAEGNQRQGTADDFDTLMQIPDADAAARWAEEVYGTTRAAALLNHRQEVIKLARNRNNALQEAQKTAGEREKARQEASTAQQRALSEKWSKLNTEAAEKYPHWFKEEDGDDKGNELLRKGYNLADSAFNGNNLSPEQMVELHSAIRNRAAGFDRLAYKYNKANRRIKELEAELKSFQDSEPKNGDGKRTESNEPSEMDWERNLEANWKT